MQAVAANLWAASTTQARRNLWYRLQHWCTDNHVPVTPNAAALFVLATGVSPQAQLAYATALSGIFRHFGVDTQPLLSTAAALRAAGGKVPLSQAAPIPKDTLVAWARRQKPDVQLAALLAWKCVARWGEVQKLSRAQFLVVSPEEIIIDWHTTPKGRRANPFTLTKFTVITGDLTGQCAALVTTLTPFTTLTTLTTEGLNARWQVLPVMAPYSAHSIKRGAITHLLRLIAEGTPIPEELVSRVAKHTTPHTTGLTEMTVRYGADPVALARVLRTAEVTRYL